jgi:hypothetical protein
VGDPGPDVSRGAARGYREPSLLQPTNVAADSPHVAIQQQRQILLAEVGALLFRFTCHAQYLLLAFGRAAEVVQRL